MNKETIRSRVRARKAMLTPAEKAAAAESAWRMLESTAAFMMAEKILLYHSLADELDTRAFLHRWHTRKKFFLPRVNGVNLDLLPYDPAALFRGAYSIMEPSGCETAPLSEMELVIVPGVAFDRSGNRVGRGKGFYDRLLEECRAVKVGVGYDFQLMGDEEIETGAHDVPVDIIITERRYLRAGGKRRR